MGSAQNPSSSVAVVKVQLSSEVTAEVPIPVTLLILSQCVKQSQRRHSQERESISAEILHCTVQWLNFHVVCVHCATAHI